MTLQVVVADDDAAEGEAGLMNVVSAFAADSQPTHLMQPADRSFDGPAVNAQSAAVWGVPSG